MRKSWGAAIGAIAVAGAVLTPAAALAATNAPAATGPSASTTTTFNVGNGALTITAPDTAFLGAGLPGTTISGQLGIVTVNDNRASLTASWVASAAATNFTTGTHTAAETIPATDLSYTVGDFFNIVGTITPTASDLASMTIASQPVVTGSAGVGDNAVSWNPTIGVAVPANAVTGTYTGTITHSVL
jgi:hypothetical protein